MMKNNYNIRQNCPTGSIPYTIRSGDTLYVLAKRYNTTVEAIMAINPGINPNRLQIGQVICIPQAGTPPGPSCPNGFFYSVRPGDTFYTIAQRYGISVESMIKANPNVNPNGLQIGQVICVPVNVAPPETGCPNGFYHTIKAGDTFFNLSKQYNVSMDAIMRANPGVDPNRLQIGQKVCIPRM